MAHHHPIEDLATLLYTAGPAQARPAEEELRATYMLDLSALMACMETTANPYAAMFCCLSLVQAFRSRVNDSRDSYDAVFETLIVKLHAIAQTAADNPEDPTAFVIRPLLSTICRMNKLVMEFDGLGCVVDRCMAAVPPNADLTTGGLHAAVHVRLLSELVSEAQTYDSGKAQVFMTFATHRRASQAFRDGPLKPVFVYALDLLRNIQNCAGPVDDGIVGAVCELLRNVLTYDFMAIIVDETEDLFVTQFPSEWKDVLTEDALKLIGWAHHQLPMPHCLTLLRGIIGLIGTRKSFYESDDLKNAWLEFFMTQLLAVEMLPDDRLSSQEYCGTLAEAIQRFTPPHTYRDLIGCPSSQQWFTFTATFTATMFQIPFGNGGSYATTTTLMAFWSRVVGSKRVAINDERAPNADIEEFLPSMVRDFIKTRIASVDVLVDEDALDSINSQSDLLPGMITLCPNECLGPILEECVAMGPNAVVRAASTTIWICAIGAALLKHWYTNLKEEHTDVASGFLDFAAGCVATYQNQQARNDGAVENALVHFLSQLHCVFSSNRLSPALATVLKNVFTDKTALFQFILSSVAVNMTSTVLEPATIASSIEVIVDACKELPVEILLDMNVDIRAIESLPFSSNVDTYKLRTPLSKALFTLRVPGTFMPERFMNFMESTEALMRGPQPEPLFTAGWIRDLRGIVSAASSTQAAFADVLDWLMERNELLNEVARTPNLPSIIVISYMKFLQQLVTPAFPSGRVNVPSMTHSAAGIYLFQFVAEKMQLLLHNSVVTSEATAALTEGQVHPMLWQQTLKPLAIAMEICRRCISGEFCPFGAMMLYGDTRFDETVCSVVSFAKQVPPQYFKDYVKLGTALMFLLRTMHENSALTPFASMETDDVHFLIARAMQVVAAVEEKTAVASNALSFLSLIGSLYPEVLRMRNNGTSNQSPNSPTRSTRAVKEAIARLLIDDVALWDDLVISAMSVVTMQDRGLSAAGNTVFPIFEADSSKWSMYRQHLLESHPPAKRERVAELLETLGSNVTTSDAFFSNLVHFRMAIRML